MSAPSDSPGRVLHVLRDPPLDGPTNMARDEHLLHAAELRPAVLRLYRWHPATLSLGYFQRYAEVERLPPELRGLAAVRRITGGGAILHDQEQTYCLVLDESHAMARRSPIALYELVHGAWREALEAEGVFASPAPDDWPLPTPRSGPFFCFEKAGRTDLLLGEGKLLGSAQRRVAGRVLQHGSLILGRRFAAHPGASLALSGPAQVERIVSGFCGALAARLGLPACEAAWTETALADVAARRARYAGDDWLRLR